MGILDLELVRKQYRLFKDSLPNVNVKYAMKVLTHPSVVKCLYEMGSGFDVATNGEADILRDLGIDPKDSIHTHPVKKGKDISYAFDFGLRTFVFDNMGELEKFVLFKDKIKLLLRITTPNTSSKFDLSEKFGAEP